MANNKKALQHVMRASRQADALAGRLENLAINYRKLALALRKEVQTLTATTSHKPPQQ